MKQAILAMSVLLTAGSVQANTFTWVSLYFDECAETYADVAHITHKRADVVILQKTEDHCTENGETITSYMTVRYLCGQSLRQEGSAPLEKVYPGSWMERNYNYLCSL